jgi:23S rRNA pseudouridine1911/1915/1917 synthase
VSTPPDIPPPDAPLIEEPDHSEDADVAHIYFRATKKQARRIDQFLVDRVAWLSRAAVQRLIDEELVKVNGKPTKASYRIKSGDVVEMVAPPEPVNDLVPEPIPLDIIYEDEHFLALNKQAGLMVHPARGRWTGTLVNGLAHYGSKWSGVNGAWRPGILHRLDRNTTGIMLVAKSDEAHWRLARQFENRTSQRRPPGPHPLRSAADLHARFGWPIYPAEIMAQNGPDPSIAGAYVGGRFPHGWGYHVWWPRF